MFTIIGLMLAGMLLGYLLINKRLNGIDKAITLLIWLLLFILGVELGGNQQVMKGLHTIGLEAVLLSVCATLGSVTAAWALWRALRKQRENPGQEKNPKEESPKPITPPNQKESPKQTEGNGMSGSAIIVGFFVLGTLCGVLHLLPSQAITDNKVGYYALCALMLCVGLSVGNNPKTLKSFRSLNPRLLLLPIMTILGTLAGSLVAGMILTHRSLADCLAVGSGFGYYSLSSIFITQYKGAELGTIALLANISREVLTLLGAPVMARWFGKLAPISAGGATTMDTTLPIIARTAGQQYVVVSIFHGFVVDFSVPFLVTLFCSFP